MAESWFSLSRDDQAEALEYEAARIGRPAHLLEKDIWVVWALSAIYESTLASKLTFKGGTSLSKVYHIIDRFSEDVDLTYDIRELRGLLDAFNTAKQTAWQTVVKIVTTGFVLALVAGALIKLKLFGGGL
jgi:predicted nucleotidyltransferase component of viral defense system